jgi:hypothetical protein
MPISRALRSLGSSSRTAAPTSPTDSSPSNNSRSSSASSSLRSSPAAAITMSSKRSSKPRRRPPLPKAATWQEVCRQLKPPYLKLRRVSPLAALAAIDASLLLLTEQLKLHQEIVDRVARDRRRHKL